MSKPVTLTPVSPLSGRRFALVVGCNASADDKNIAPLKSAEHDAESLAYVLRSTSCDFVDVLLLKGNQATAQNVRRTITRLTRQSNDSDLLLFFFSGHALPLPTDGGREDIFFVTTDFVTEDARDDSTSYFSMHWLHEHLFQTKDVGSVVIILDCCYAGNVVSTRSDPLHIDLRGLIKRYDQGASITNELHQERLRIILTASGYNEKAWEQHGFLSKHLLPGLRGEIEAALDAQGNVTLHDLHKHLQDNLPEEQRPYLIGKLTRQCHLARYPHQSRAEREAERQRRRNDELDEVAKRTAAYAIQDAILSDPDYFDQRATNKRPFDHSLCRGGALLDIEQAKFEHFLQRERVQQKIARNPDEQDFTALFKLVRDSLPTYGALLCFGKYPQKWVIGAQTRCIAWDGDEQDTMVDRFDIENDLLSQYASSIQFLRKHLAIRRDRSREEGSDQWEIPFVVLREAVANALVHRDYRKRNDGIYIEIFQNRIEITNPGLLPEGTTPDTFISSSAQGLYTNPLIAEIFYLSGHVEQVGSGMRMMTRKMEQAGLQPLEFKEIKDTQKFKVILYRPKLIEHQAQHVHGSHYNTGRDITIINLPPPPAPGSAPLRPALVIGRDDDLRRLKQRVMIDEKAPTSMSVLTAMRGWPGVGKTTLAATLAHDSEIRERFPDGVLWASLGQQPSLFGELAAWGRALGVPDLNQVRTIDEASALLRGLLRDKRALLIVDDAWQASHVVPFNIGGSDCALLVTTRLPEVAREIAPTSDDIYILGVLSEADALELLRTLAPTVVAENEVTSRELVNDLEGLPLALQVAGRLLHTEASYGFDITDLLHDIREGAALIAADAPADRADVANETTPSVAALLASSTNRLDAETLDRFAYLGAFAPKPATFDAEAMKAVWLADDPKPTIRTLVDRGLLEPSSKGRFWMHAILVKHAQSFLTQE